jgi:hypothetical protein
MYRSLNGLIIRNATSVTPISDFHIYLQNLNLNNEEMSKIYQKMNKKEKKISQIEELLTSDYMNGLCINGSAPLTIHNSMNHNCEPNVTSMSSTNDHRVSIVAIKEIKKGDELCLSYIDESLNVHQRRRLLYDNYLFTCNCQKCLRELKLFL